MPVLNLLPNVATASSLSIDDIPLIALTGIVVDVADGVRRSRPFFIGPLSEGT